MTWLEKRSVFFSQAAFPHSNAAMFWPVVTVAWVPK